MLTVAASSLVMVPVPVDVPRVMGRLMVARLLRPTVNVSVDSTFVSPVTSTVSVWVVVPALNVSVPV